MPTERLAAPLTYHVPKSRSVVPGEMQYDEHAAHSVLFPTGEFLYTIRVNDNELFTLRLERLVEVWSTAKGQARLALLPLLGLQPSDQKQTYGTPSKDMQ